MRYLPICILGILLSSCAHLFGQSTTEVYLHVPEGSTVCYFNGSGHQDTLRSGNMRQVLLVVQRSCDRLPLTIIHDGDTAFIAVKPKLLSGRGAGLSCTYPYEVYTDPGNARGYSLRKRFIAPRLQLSILPPFLTLCGIRLDGLASHGVGTIEGLGVNYFVNPGVFYSASAAFAGDPLQLGDRFYADSVRPPAETHKLAWYIDVQRHNVFHRFDIGYGLSAGQRFGSIYYPRHPYATHPHDSIIYQLNVFTAGCSFSAGYRITRSFYAGINYQPQFLEVDDKTTWKYSHIISAGFYWRIRLKAANKRTL